jgi:hypothetical protein
MGLKDFVQTLVDGWQKKDEFIADAHDAGLSISPFVPGGILPYVNQGDDDETWGEIVLGGTADEVAEKARRLLEPRGWVRPQV